MNCFDTVLKFLFLRILFAMLAIGGNLFSITSNGLDWVGLSCVTKINICSSLAWQFQVKRNTSVATLLKNTLFQIKLIGLENN